MLDDRTRRLLDARLARDQADERVPSIVAGLARDGEHTLSLSGDELELSGPGTDGPGLRFRHDSGGGWRGVDTRTPYDPGGPVPGGVSPDAWHGDGAS